MKATVKIDVDTGHAWLEVNGEKVDNVSIVPYTLKKLWPSLDSDRVLNEDRQIVAVKIPPMRLKAEVIITI